jgi:hypothetical protein
MNIKLIKRRMKRRIYRVLRCLFTTKQWKAIYDLAFTVVWDRNGRTARETYDDNSATTAMLVENLIKSGLSEYKVLSVTGKIGYLIPLVPMFSKVVHCTMLPIERKDDIADLIEDKIVEYVGDFFGIPDNDSLFKELNVVISYATIHCKNDTRYLNLGGGRRNDHIGLLRNCADCVQM